MRALRVAASAFCLSLACQVSLAQTTDKKFDSTLPEMPLISVDHRVGKTVFIALEPLGRLSTPGYGFRAGYYLFPDSLVGINYALGNVNLNGAIYDSTLIEVTYKRFLTNSFYMDAGFASEQIDVKYNVVSAALPVASVESNAEFQRWGVVLHMGNQWQWNHFTLGCDWLGHQLSLSRKESFNPAGAGDPGDEARQKRDVKKAARSTLQVLRFFLGFSF